MAYVRPRRVFWQLPPTATHGRFHMASAGDAAFMPSLLNTPQSVVPYKRLLAASPQEVVFGVGDVPDGAYQFAVVAEQEDTGKFADPYQHLNWVNVPLDLSPLPPAFGGGSELL